MANNKNINQLLVKFDTILDDLGETLATQALNDFKKKKHQITFSMADTLNDIQQNTYALPDKAGLYLFEVNLRDFYKNQFDSNQVWKNSKEIAKREHFFNRLEAIWSECEERANSTYPKLIKKRLLKHYYLRPYKNNFVDNEWVPLYLGINKNIQKRVFQHIKCDSSTFSMKLSQLSATDFKEIPIRVSISAFPNLESKSRYIIVKEIEKNLRDVLHPLVGKQ